MGVIKLYSETSLCDHTDHPNHLIIEDVPIITTVYLIRPHIGPMGGCNDEVSLYNIISNR